jgi:excisionase family DNA binding protein
MQNRQRFFITAEVADLCRVRPRTIRRWRADGLLDAVRMGRRWLYPKSALEQVLAHQAAAQAAAQAIEEVSTP